MKFAAQLMQFMVLIPAATLCFLPMKNQLAAPPKKIIACIGLVLAIMIPVSALILTAGTFPANYVMLPTSQSFTCFTTARSIPIGPPAPRYFYW